MGWGTILWWGGEPFCGASPSCEPSVTDGVNWATYLTGQDQDGALWRGSFLLFNGRCREELASGVPDAHYNFDDRGLEAG